MGCAAAPSATAAGRGGQQGKLQPAVLGVAGGVLRASADFTREPRQDDGGDGDGDDAERKLVQPVGIGEVGHRADRRERGNGGGDGDVDLGGAGADDAGHHHPQQRRDLTREYWEGAAARADRRASRTSRARGTGRSRTG